MNSNHIIMSTTKQNFINLVDDNYQEALDFLDTCSNQPDTEFALQEFIRFSPDNDNHFQFKTFFEAVFPIPLSSLEQHLSTR